MIDSKILDIISDKVEEVIKTVCNDHDLNFGQFRKRYAENFCNISFDLFTTNPDVEYFKLLREHPLLKSKSLDFNMKIFNKETNNALYLVGLDPEQKDIVLLKSDNEDYYTVTVEELLDLIK